MVCHFHMLWFVGRVFLLQARVQAEVYDGGREALVFGVEEAEGVVQGVFVLLPKFAKVKQNKKTQIKKVGVLVRLCEV